MIIEILFCLEMALATVITCIGGYIALCMHADATSREKDNESYTSAQRQANYRWANIAGLLVFIGSIMNIATYVHFDSNYSVFEMNKITSITSTVIFNMQGGLFVMIVGALLFYPGRLDDIVGVGIQKLKYSMYFLMHGFKVSMFFHAFWILGGTTTFLWGFLLALSKL